MRRQQTLLTILVAAACVLPAVPRTVGELSSKVSLAASLLPLSTAERQVAVQGWPARMAAELKGTEPVDFVMLDEGARAYAQFTGALLPGRACRYFDGFEAWEKRERAIFFRDDKAANAPPGPPPPKARVVVVVDSRREPPMWLK